MKFKDSCEETVNWELAIFKKGKKKDCYIQNIFSPAHCICAAGVVQFYKATRRQSFPSSQRYKACLQQKASGACVCNSANSCHKATALKSSHMKQLV